MSPRHSGFFLFFVTRNFSFFEVASPKLHRSTCLLLLLAIIFPTHPTLPITPPIRSYSSKMPRILSQESFNRRRNSPSRSSLSLLLNSHGGASVSPRRHTPFRNNTNSKYSLTRMNKSSSSSLRQMVLSYSGCVHDISYGSSRPSSPSSSPSSKCNAGWATVSDTSSEQSDYSRTSSQSSLTQQPTTTASQSDAMKRFCGALQKQQQQQASARRVSITESSSFLPQVAHAQDDTTWGQFVDVADAEEELVRMSKFLSIRRHIDIIPLMENDPLDF